jgi:hypothetical protein
MRPKPKKESAVVSKNILNSEYSRHPQKISGRSVLREKLLKEMKELFENFKDAGKLPRGMVCEGVQNHNSLVQLYHELIDKRLSGILSRKEKRQLKEIEETLQAFEDAESYETDRILEQRHRMLMQQLDDLTAELRKFGAGGQQQSKIL